MPEFVMLEPGQSHFSLEDKPKAGAGRVLLMLLGAIALIGSCLFGLTLNQQKGSEKSPSGVSAPKLTTTAPPTASLAPSQATVEAATATIAPLTATSSPTATPNATQTPWIVVTVRTDTRTINNPYPVTQIVEVTQLVPVVTVFVTQLPPIIMVVTATPSAAPSPTMTIPASPTPTATPTETATASSTPTETATP